ncbi:MAG: hypothetical protein GX329_05150 [Tissierellia bacterium]|nr:hypothetical protein [Tissierellia bacterium]
MKKDNRIFRKLAGAIAIALIFGILLITNAFVGNPISAGIAGRAIDRYVEEKYASLGLEVEKPVYNFKDGSYVSKARSNTSIDTNFYINYRGGDVYYDSYEDDVLGMWNTLGRLSKEYSNLVTDMVANDLGYEENSTWVSYDEKVYENPREVLELDMKFDRELSIPTEVMIDIGMENPTLDKASAILVDAHDIFKKSRCRFQKYSIFLKDEGTIVNIMGVRPKDIESGKLLSLLKEALEREDQELTKDEQDKPTEPEGIFVDIMERD